MKTENESPHDALNLLFPKISKVFKLIFRARFDQSVINATIKKIHEVKYTCRDLLLTHLQQERRRKQSKTRAIFIAL